jgi:hypothetical protein
MMRKAAQKIFQDHEADRDRQDHQAHGGIGEDIELVHDIVRPELKGEPSGMGSRRPA